MSRAWFAAVVVLVGSMSVWAQDAPPQGPFVVLVGVGSFADKAIEPRPTAEPDARALAKIFADPAYFDAGPGRVIVLTTTPNEAAGERKATRENVVKALHEAVEKTSKGDTLVFGFFGRGASAGDKTCFFAADSTFTDRAKTGLLGSDLGPDLKAAQNRKLCLLFDVAFKGFDPGKEVLAEPNLRDILSAVYGGDESREGPPPPDKLVALSSIPSNPPLTKGDHGLFASMLLDALTGAADVEGYAPDGLVTIDELVKYLETTGQAEARAIGKTIAEKETIPYLIGEEMSHYPLTKNPKVTGKVESRLKELAKLEMNKSVSKDAAEEGRVLLARMPKLKLQQDLRKQYEALTDGTTQPEAFAAARETIKGAMKLPASEADKFARTTMRAIETVKTVYVKEIATGDWAAMAIRGLYRKLETPVPDDVKDDLKNSKSFTRAKAQELLKDVRDRLGRREDLADEKDVDSAVMMMLAELGPKDPHSVYYDKELIKKMDAPLRGEFRGVGIQIRRDLVRDGLLVVSPIKGSPAYLAGIQAGDLITEIRRDVGAQGEPLAADAPKVISTKGMKTEQALEIILGKVGVPVTLVVERQGEKQPREYTIRRGLVSVETVLGTKRDAKDDWNFYVDEESRIGYICLTQFAPTTARDLNAAVIKLQKTGLKGLVLDLRFNGGGLLTQAVAISDLFIDDGLIVSVKYRHKEPENWFDRGLGAYLNFPMAVLVNGSSASASEIVSACLQDYNRAIVVGERSYGKGSVQNVIDFEPTGGQLKLTTARYFPPLGRNIDKKSTDEKETDEWGVKPDKGFEVKLTRDELTDLAEQFREREIIRPKDTLAKDGTALKVHEDKQLQRAVEYLKGQLKAQADKPIKKNG